MRIQSGQHPSKKNRRGGRKKGMVAGVHIDHDAVYMVKALRNKSGVYVLRGFRRVACPQTTLSQTAELAAFLKKELKDFCGKDKPLALWSSLVSPDIEIRLLKIPPVASSKRSAMVRWTVAKELQLNEKTQIFDYEVVDEVSDKGIPKLAVLAYIAPRLEAEGIQKLFAQADWPLTGLTPEPFALQNLFRSQFFINSDTVACLHIADEFSRIDIFKADTLVLTRTIKTGINSMVEAIGHAGVSSAPPPAPDALVETADGEILSVPTIYDELELEPEPMDTAQALHRLRNLSASRDAGAADSDIAILIRPVLERLVRQVERTLEYSISQHSNAPVTKVFLVCTLPLHALVADLITAQLGLATEVLNPLGNTIGHPLNYIETSAAAADAPTTSESATFIAAVGLALSDNRHTPNLLYTYKERERDGAVSRINRSIFIVFMLLTGVCALFFIYQNIQIRHKEDAIKTVEQQIAMFDPGITRSGVEALLAQARQQRQTSRNYAARYRYLAAISEVTALTPPAVELISLEQELGKLPPDPTNTAAAAPDTATLRLEGLVPGTEAERHDTFSSYLIRLDSSPLFAETSVQENKAVLFGGNEVLHFIVSLKLAVP